jgi:glycosyltransferase involved in cell wall biosynthesis
VQLAPDNEVWLEEFRSKHGRAPRVLHIGNIANNAYLNAKFLRSVGVESDVLCGDYYHIMGCPEWDEALVDGHFGSPEQPQWHRAQLNGFVRPDWFVQGPIDTCLDYLSARNSGRVKKAKILWERLRIANGTQSNGTKISFFKRRRSVWGRIKRLIWVLMFEQPLPSAHRSANPVDGRILEVLRRLRRKCRRTVRTMLGIPLRFIGRVLFSKRAALLSLSDVSTYLALVPKCARVFRYYDVVQGYATDGIYPMLAGHKYVAYEHGTIRSIPFEDTTQGRLCALTYQMADAVVITNADNLDSARKLGLQRYFFVPHPVNDLRCNESDSAGLRVALLQELRANFLIFHPARQHWEARRHPSWEKGNDYFIKAFARFVKTTNPKAGAVFVEWGQSVRQSKELLRSMGVADRVKWIAPQSHRRMLAYITACDVLADQFFLGAFGTTMPKALMCGRPAMIYLNTEIHRWCFPQAPPVVNVNSSEEIFASLCRLNNEPAYRTSIQELGKEWYWRWHSSERGVNLLLEVYRQVLGTCNE